MGEKHNTQAQIERLIELANELEKRELALNQESKHLESLRMALDEREHRLSAAAAEAKRAEAAVPKTPPETAAPLLRERPIIAPAVEKQVVPKPAPKPQAETLVKAPPAAPAAPAKAASVQTVEEINEILQSIFLDYTSSVHQISSQLSTVTAAMMCSAVTCVLENRGYNVKDVFMDEMEKILKGGGLGEVCPAPPENAGPAPDNESSAEPQAMDADDEDDEDDDDIEDVFVPAAVPQASRQTGDGTLHIGTVQEFHMLGEYGFRNDETIARVTLPEGVQQLPGSFFYGCRKLTEVWLPDSLREIGPYAFYGCENLTAVHLGETSELREIGEYAFAMCPALREFEVPEAVETLGTSVFRFCSALEELSFFKDGYLRSVGSHLLQNCTSLEKLRLPDTITTIPTSMFYGCSKLKKVVAKGVDTIEDYAFYGNENLRTIRVRAKKAISALAFEGCSPELEIEYLNY